MKHISPLAKRCFLLCLICCSFIWHVGWEEAIYAAPSHSFGIQLPAPLYVLQDYREIIRIEPDGQITNIITEPMGGIDEFDVSPVHGRLAYVMGNQLIEVDPQSGRRVEKFNAFYRNQGRLSAPRYAPDSNHIIFIMQGTLWITRSGLDLDSAVTRMISEETLDIPSDLFPLGELFTASWSPNGSQILLVEKRVFGNDYRYLILDLDTNTLTMVGRSWPDPVTCCTITWSPDGEVAAVTNVRREIESGYERPIEQSLAHTAVVGLTARGGQYQVDLPPCDAHPHYATGCGLVALLTQADQSAQALRQSRAADPNRISAILYYDQNQWTEVGLTNKVTVGTPLLWSPHNNGFVTVATGNTPRGGYPIQTLQWLGMNIPTGDLLTIDLALERVTQLRWGSMVTTTVSTDSDDISEVTPLSTITISAPQLYHDPVLDFTLRYASGWSLDAQEGTGINDGGGRTLIFTKDGYQLHMMIQNTPSDPGICGGLFPKDTLNDYWHYTLDDLEIWRIKAEEGKINGYYDDQTSFLDIVSPDELTDRFGADYAGSYSCAFVTAEKLLQIGYQLPLSLDELAAGGFDADTLAEMDFIVTSLVWDHK